MAASASGAMGTFDHATQYLPEEVRGYVSILDGPLHATSLEAQDQVLKLSSLQPKITLSIKRTLDFQHLLKERRNILEGRLTPGEAKDFTVALSNGIAELDRAHWALDALLAKSCTVAGRLVEYTFTDEEPQQVLRGTAS
ncbi:MAG: hypothetical protein Q9204_002799 [Flavoplaca sp. TL-2023a]